MNKKEQVSILKPSFLISLEDSNNIFPQSREEIDLWVEDFETDTSDWILGSGWNISTDDANSPTHSLSLIHI